MPDEQMVEVISHIAYDAVTLGASDKEAYFFSEQLGGGGTPKTLFETNMEDGGKFASNSGFRMLGLRIGVLPDLTVALAVALSKGFFQLFIGQKPYIELPIFAMSVGGGLFINSGDSSAGTTEYGMFGVPHQYSVAGLARPLTIDPGQVFSAKMTWPTAPTACKVYVGLDGELIRQIQ